MFLSDIKNTTKPIQNHHPDPRLNNPKFRHDVRLVFHNLRIENTVRNFKIYDGVIDWKLFAAGVRNPTVAAVVRIRGSKDTILLDLPGSNRAEAIRNLDVSEYSFVRWF